MFERDGVDSVPDFAVDAIHDDSHGLGPLIEVSARPCHIRCPWDRSSEVTGSMFVFYINLMVISIAIVCLDEDGVSAEITITLVVNVTVITVIAPVMVEGRFNNIFNHRYGSITQATIIIIMMMMIVVIGSYVRGCRGTH
jgi:hypothetical protein